MCTGYVIKTKLRWKPMDALSLTILIWNHWLKFGVTIFLDGTSEKSSRNRPDYRKSVASHRSTWQAMPFKQKSQWNTWELGPTTGGRNRLSAAVSFQMSLFSANAHFCNSSAVCNWLFQRLFCFGISELSGSIAGPPDTPYEGGTFQLEIKIPGTYPFNPPKVGFGFNLTCLLVIFWVALSLNM